MVEVYCRLIASKRRSFGMVPDELKEKVEARLKELGLNTDGEPIKQEA